MFEPIRLFDALRKRFKRIFVKPQSGIKTFGTVKFNITLTNDLNTRDMALGEYEIPVVRALRNHLKPGDTFIDIGANIGYLTAVAMSLVGQKGRVYAFEPVPTYFQSLERLRKLNPDFQVHVESCALGDRQATMTIAVTNSPNIGWNTMVPRFMPEHTIKEKIPINVRRLDDYLLAHQTDSVRLIKIDTEGYEYPVLQGMTNYLSLCSVKPLLIVEISPEAYPMLGLQLQDLENWMQTFGYSAQELTQKTPVIISALKTTKDVLLVPVALGSTGAHL